MPVDAPRPFSRGSTSHNVRPSRNFESCRLERPSTSRQAAAGARRRSSVMSRDGERVGRRRADGRDAARPARAAGIHRAFQPCCGPPAEDVSLAGTHPHRWRGVPLERLSASAHHLAKAIASLTLERSAGYSVTLPFGTISLFELADLTVAHVASAPRTGGADTPSVSSRRPEPHPVYNRVAIGSSGVPPIRMWEKKTVARALRLL